MKPESNSLNFWVSARMSWRGRYNIYHFGSKLVFDDTLLCIFVSDCISVFFAQISKCLGKNFQANGHGVDAKDLAEKMQQLSTEVSNVQLQTNQFMSKYF